MRKITYTVVAFMFATEGIPSFALAAESYKHAKKTTELVQPLSDSGTLPALSIGIIDGEDRWSVNFGQLAKDRPQTIRFMRSDQSARFLRVSC